MAAFINTNISSLNAQRNLNASQSSLATSLQRLSTGLRINSAKDDAAGLAISERMTSQIRGSDQAARNANDGISLAQTAEGDLGQIGNNLQRMRELAVQASNATNSASDRAALNSEVQALAAEIDRVAGNSSFNGVNLLDGSFTAQTFQIGANATANDQIKIDSISSARTSDLGGVGTSYAAKTTGTATTGALTAGALTLNGYQVGASSVGAAPGQSAASASSIAKAINAISSNSGVTATADTNVVKGVAATTPSSIAADTFSINGVNVGAIASGTTAAGQGANVAAAINKISTQTGVTASANATTGEVSLTAADGRDINLQLTGVASSLTTAATAKADFLAKTGLSADQAAAAVNGTAITSTQTSNTLTGASGTIAAGALTANGIALGQISWGTATSAVEGTASGAAATMTAGSAAAASGSTATVLAAGTLYFTEAGAPGTKINVGAITLAANNTAAQNGTAIAAAINTALGANGTAAADANGVVSITSATGKDIKLGMGGASADTTTAAADKATLQTLTGFTAAQLGTKASGGAAGQASAIANAISTALASAPGGAAVNGKASVGAITAGVGAATYSITMGSSNSVVLGSGLTATSATAATTNQATLSSNATGIGLSTALIGMQAAATNTDNHGTISLSSTSENGIVFGGSNAALAGLSASGGKVTATVTSSVKSIASINVLTAASATEALKAIDGALESVNTSRASLGAYQNRFASVVSTLQTTSENLSASRSRIQDADFAKETASLTRGQILQQAGTAMLAQANSLPNGVLSLLRG